MLSAPNVEQQMPVRVFTTPLSVMSKDTRSCIDLLAEGVVVEFSYASGPLGRLEGQG